MSDEKKEWEEAPDDQFVCYCREVDKGAILKAIKNGASTVKDIQDQTTACTGESRCSELNPKGRCCLPEIKLLLEIYEGEGETEEGGCCDSGCCCG